MPDFPDYNMPGEFDYLNQLGQPDVGGLDLGSLFGQGSGGLSGLGSLFGQTGDGLGGLSGLLGGQGGGGLSGLGSLFGQGGGGGIPGIGSITNLLSGIGSLMQGGAGGDVKGAMDITGALVSLIPGIGQIAGPALAAIGNLIGPMIQGLPGNVKPDMFANYLKQQGGLAGDLGELISSAQQAAGTKGVLSQSGKGAYNPEFESGLLEALTGQSIGSVTAPPSGGAKQGITMNFNPAANILSALGLGAGGAGYTPEELSSPKAIKAIMSATKGGKVGTGEHLGAKKIGDYLPAVEQALAKVGILPRQTGDGTGDTFTTPGGQGGDGQPGDDTWKYTHQPTGGDSKTPDLTGLLKLLQNLIPGVPGSTQGGIGIGYGGQGGSATATANPTINIAAPKQAPFFQASGGFTPGITFNPLPRL